MSEEEQEAIWYCSEMLADNENDIGHWKIVENLINKQQKEIEETAIRQMIATTNYWKDKIKAKIKELEKEKDSYFNENGFVPSYIQKLINTNNKIVILEELLEGDKEND